MFVNVFFFKLVFMNQTETSIIKKMSCCPNFCYFVLILLCVCIQQIWRSHFG